MSASSDYFSDNETERPNEHEINEEESNEIDFEVLHPEHPLMIKFQKALKKSLLNKIQKLELENNELVSLHNISITCKSTLPWNVNLHFMFGNLRIYTETGILSLQISI